MRSTLRAIWLLVPDPFSEAPFLRLDRALERDAYDKNDTPEVRGYESRLSAADDELNKNGVSE